MRKVTTVNLNGNAYQLEESAYERLRAYLDDADARLRGNPDRAEIVADLEQAIADKCAAILGPHKSVVSEAEIEQILREMGTVESSAADERGSAPHADAADDRRPAEGRPRGKRMYRLPSEGMFGGVCAGLAAYLNIDVVWVRLAFVGLTLVTGVWIVVWLALLFVMPAARTADEIAAAHGEPLNAREVIERAKKKSAEFARSAGADARRTWERFGSDMKNAGDRMAAGFADVNDNAREYSHTLRDRARRRRAYRTRAESSVSPGARIAASVSLPILSILSAVLFVAFLLVLLALATGGAVLGFLPLATVPIWAAVLLTVFVYGVIAAPVGAARRLSVRYANGGAAYGWANAWGGLMWLALVVGLLWAAWQFAPGVSSLFDELPFRSTVTL